MSDPADLSPEVSRILSLLELLVSAKKLSIRALERRLEVSNGTLARLFVGKISLKFQHILDLLEVLQVPPGGFFKVAYSDRPGSSGAEELLWQVKSLALTDPREEEPVLTRADVLRMIEEALEARENPPPEPPAKPPRPSRKPRRPK